MDRKSTHASPLSKSLTCCDSLFLSKKSASYQLGTNMTRFPYQILHASSQVRAEALQILFSCNTVQLLGNVDCKAPRPLQPMQGQLQYMKHLDRQHFEAIRSMTINLMVTWNACGRQSFQELLNVVYRRKERLDSLTLNMPSYLKTWYVDRIVELRDRKLAKYIVVNTRYGLLPDVSASTHTEHNEVLQKLERLSGVLVGEDKATQWR